MGSQQKETRQLQLEQIGAQIEKRTALLKSQDKTDAEISKDPQLKQLRGNLRRTKEAIASIEKLERLQSQQMVEEAMLSCNQSAAEFLSEQHNGLFWVNPGFKADQLPGVKRLLAANLPEFSEKDVR